MSNFGLEDTGTGTSIRILGGGVFGGEAIVIESLDDLAAIQSTCATTENIFKLHDILSLHEFRMSFPTRKSDWHTNGDRYRTELLAKLIKAAEDELSEIEYLRLALTIAERIWQHEGEESDLALVLGVADTGGILELTGTEPTMVLSYGSIKTFFCGPFEYVKEIASWFIALVKGRGSSHAISTNIVAKLRNKRIDEIPIEDISLLNLLQLNLVEENDIRNRDHAIVFVHGIISTDIGTFDGFIRGFNERHKKLAGRTLFIGWPHDTLASISSNAYDLAELIHSKIGKYDRDIIFVCHSRGGLVARQAALYCYNIDSRYRRAIKGCLTFGTPHKGADLALQFSSDAFLSHFISVAMSMATSGLIPLSDILHYIRVNGGIINGVEDLCPPNPGRFIHQLQIDEISDPSKRNGSIRQLPIFAIGGHYVGAPNEALAIIADRYFGIGIEHDLVVGAYSSIPDSADYREMLNCSHVTYCCDEVRNSNGFLKAIDTVSKWFTIIDSTMV